MAQSGTPIHSVSDLYGIELNGQLSANTQDKAQFALLLALHESKVASSLHIHEDNDEEYDNVERALNSINHYPTLPFSISTDAIKRINKQSLLRSRGENVDAWLLECAHPAPIHYKNAANEIEPQIIENCGYRTQLFHRQTENVPTGVESDPTLLTDIVPASHTML